MRSHEKHYTFHQFVAASVTSGGAGPTTASAGQGHFGFSHNGFHIAAKLLRCRQRVF